MFGRVTLNGCQVEFYSMPSNPILLVCRAAVPIDDGRSGEVFDFRPNVGPSCNMPAPPLWAAYQSVCTSLVNAKYGWLHEAVSKFLKLAKVD